MAKKSAKKKKADTVRRLTLAGAIVALVLGIVFVAVGAVLLNFRYDRNISLDGLNDTDLGITDTEDPDSGVINIGLFGVDSRSSNSFRGRSDCLMILSIDTTHNKIKLTSVLRDSLVYIDGYRPNKINAAYAFGGAPLAIKTLNTNFNLNIRDYATINFAGMADVIDAMGGIDIEITEPEMNDANIHIRSLNIESRKAGGPETPLDLIKSYGKIHVSGIQAVCFARIRHVRTVSGQSNDFGRTDRQRYVLEQLFNKVVGMPISEYPAIIKSLLPYLETSLTYSEILSLSKVLVSNGISLTQERVPANSYIIDSDYREATGGSTVYYDLDYATDLIHAFIYDDVSSDEYMQEHPATRNEWYR